MMTPVPYRPPSVDVAPGIQRADPIPGQLVGGTYRVIRALGEGGMGSVYHGIDERLARDVAIKLVHLDRLGASEHLHDRFIQEARMMARVRHPNVVAIYALGDYDQRPYIVMEYVPGQNLDEWLEARGRDQVSVDEALGILDQLSRGVQAIHDAGTVHRDIKPSNVLIGQSFRVAICDLGLGQTQAERLRENTQTIAGTPAYIAPEVALLQRVDPEHVHALDIYSLGVVAYELLTGQLPFEADSTTEMLRQVAYAPARPASEIRPELPPAFDRVLARAMAKDPAERTQSAEQFRRELARARDTSRKTTSGLRILVADDDADCRNLTEELLLDAFPGATVELVADGSAAYRSALDRPPSLAIVDLQMPGLDGLELTARLRAETATHHVPIVVVTGVGGAPDWQALRQMGAAGFLVKPVDPDSLIALVRRAAVPNAGSSGTFQRTP